MKLIVNGIRRIENQLGKFDKNIVKLEKKI